VGSSFWRGLLEWMATVAVREGTLTPADLELIEIVDEPEEVVQRVNASRAARESPSDRPE
jgi:predicted Rossmann-fold nucleotide-binding protein